MNAIAQRRLDASGTNGIDAKTFRSDVERCTPGESNDTMPGRMVGRATWQSN
jgi:hypothetical protein